ncbi:hypothetical protein CAPTEDRAFT_21911, partial [Capitella teleta]
MKSVVFPSDHPDGLCRGVIIRGQVDFKGGLILLHAWWGLNEEIVQHADEVSRDSGFTVLVPDLYRGRIAKDRETAGHYMADLDWEGAVCDVRAAVKCLHSNGCVKVGVAGFCMGGALCWLAAAKIPEVKAAAPFYGIPKAHLADLATISVPVQGHFGEKDNVVGLSSPRDYLPLKEKLDDAGVNFELCVYGGAGHGFAHPSYKTYNEQAARAAFKSMYSFMRKHLQ